MKKITALLLAGLFCVALAATADAADPYDRYERYRDGGPPPRPAGAPPPRHAVYGQPYFFAHLGVFEPNTDTEGLEFFDSGVNFDIGVGSRVSPVLAIEGAVGSYSTDKQGLTATVVPLTVGARLIIPSPFLEPYLTGGVGIYFTDVDFPTAFNGAGQAVTAINETDTTVGVYGGAGIDAWLNPRMALNFEGKYHWAKPSIGPFDVNVGGWTVSVGLRVSF
jgi:opacity protein-like surface antigen